jgi:2-haloacid dehalogenase
MAADAPRWATFDCYGTLVDWTGGVGDELVRLFGEDRREPLLARYHEHERALQAARPTMSYRTVMARVLERLAREEGRELPDDERDVLAESLPGWRVFPDVPDALRDLRARGWRLAILSNTDRDLIEASMAAIGVPFDEAVVASEIGSYKPQTGHWERFTKLTGADPARQVHVAASTFHDVRTANRLGLPMVWINRVGETPPPDAVPTRELPDLSGLPDTADALVPPSA